MTRRLMLIHVFAMAALAAAAGDAQAQASGRWRDTCFFSADGGFQTATPGFTSSVTFPLYGEDGSMNADYRFRNAVIVAGRAGFRFAGNVGFGVGASSVSASGQAAVTARLPHPFHFNQLRRVSGEASGLTRNELMVSAELSWLLRLSRSLDVMLLAGPAYFSTSQDMVVMPRYTETYPFDEATYTGVESRAVRRTGVGYTVGLDVSWMLSRHLGLGSLVRFSRANLTFSPAAGSASLLRLGGLQIGAGLRVRY